MHNLVGIDEVGRGCWAGPLVAAAVILSEPIDGVMDSKKLTAAHRKVLAKEIYLKAVAVGVGWIDAERIDSIGLSAANREAMQLALNQIVTPYDRVIVDGNYNYLAHLDNSEAVTRADSLVPAVSAASIVAKVARDAFMTEAALQFPAYGFEKHVGYGTQFHHQQIKLHGVCKLHRLSYKPVQKLVSDIIDA
ncbi:ribonuclease HII [Candidatus Saccharibacteria bacterium]|nr:ribonuclease HII [Candidatus Saccharibacteria bacterium]